MLTHEALGGQMDKVIQQLQTQDAADTAHAFTFEHMIKVRDGLECSESLSKLFPDDFEGNIAEMNRLANAFLNQAFVNLDSIVDIPTKQTYLDATDLNLMIISDIVEAGQCTTCVTQESWNSPPVITNGNAGGYVSEDLSPEVENSEINKAAKLAHETAMGALGKCGTGSRCKALTSDNIYIMSSS